MAANTNPIFTGTPHVQVNNNITAANTALDGTGTVVTAFTAGANGSFLQRVRFRALGTNVATVGRIFINNGSSQGTASNNSLFDEITLAATTLSQVAALPTYEITVNMPLPAGYTVLVTLGTAVSAGYAVTAVGGDY